MTTSEAAAKMGVSERTIRRLIEQGAVKATMIGRDWQVTELPAEYRRNRHRNKRERREMEMDITHGTPYLWTGNGHLAKAIRTVVTGAKGTRPDVRVKTRPDGHQCWRIAHPEITTREEWEDVLRAAQGGIIKRGGDACVNAFHWWRPDPAAEGNEML